MAHVHRRSWFFVGRAEEVPNAGDYRAIDTVAGPVLLARDLAGELRAFANCCRHRGSRLLEGSGNRRAIVCPYHGWGYRLDGSLAGAPDMEGVACFRPSEQGLIPIRLALWQGFIFLTLDESAPSLVEALGNLPEVFASHHLGEMVCTWRAELDARCNWKLLVENAMESYHTGYIHAQTVGAQKSIDIETTGDWECLQVLDDRRQGHRERLGQLADRRRSPGEPFDHRAPARVGQRLEHEVERLVKHLLKYSRPAGKVKPARGFGPGKSGRPEESRPDG